MCVCVLLDRGLVLVQTSPFPNQPLPPEHITQQTAALTAAGYYFLAALIHFGFSE